MNGNSSEQRNGGWPRCGASAAIFRGDQVLLVERGKGAMRGLWSLPGGHVEPGETAEAAAKREVAEETGVVAGILGLVDVHDVILDGADGSLAAHYMIAVYFGRHVAGEPIAAGDAARARYFALSELQHLSLTPRAAELIDRAAMRNAELA